MRRKTDKVVVCVTCGSADEAGKIAVALVQQRLAACVNVLGTPVRSVYRWKRQVESATEHLLLIKTARRLLGKLQAELGKQHSYEVPEMIALPIVGGSAAYLDWLESCLENPARAPARSRRKRSRRR